MSLTLGRLILDDPSTWPEPVGEETQMTGGVPTPGSRQGIEVQPGLDAWPGGSGNVQADRQRVRRQLRSLLQNIQGRGDGMYLLWTEDTEQSGWYVPGRATIEPDGAAGTYVSNWLVSGLSLGLLGRPRTHRRAVSVSLLDRRLATSPRDYLRRLFSTDFSAQALVALSPLPSGVSDVVAHGALTPLTLTALVSGYGGASAGAAVGATDGAAVSFEQAEVNRLLGDVICYDRRGTTTMLTTGPQAAWEEVYGPDYPFTTSDCPVLDNGVCRVSYDSANTDGLRVDVWTGSAWSEQGKVTIERHDGSAWNALDTLVSGRLVEWTPERGVLKLVMTRAADTSSREEIYVTLQRGWTGPRVEVYPARTSAGAIAGAAVVWNIVALDTYTTAAAQDATGVAHQGSGPTASTGFSASDIGAATFTGENWVGILRQGASYHPVLAALQAGAAKRVASGTDAYGATRQKILIRHQTAGYISAHLGFYPGAADQIMEAESMTLGSGSTSGADAAAYNGNEVTTTRTADAIHVSRATWLTSNRGKYRIFARVQTSASTLNIYAKTTATTGGTKTTTSASFVWLDLGEIIADGSTLEIHMWASAAATTSLDRIEAVKVEDRTASPPRYDGARDLGGAGLYDSRVRLAVVER